MEFPANLVGKMICSVIIGVFRYKNAKLRPVSGPFPIQEGWIADQTGLDRRARFAFAAAAALHRAVERLVGLGKGEE
jgi:hypothetical protein